MTTADVAAVADVAVESRDSFAFAACCALVTSLDPAAPSLHATFVNSRHRDAKVVCVSHPAQNRPITFQSQALEYRVETGPVLAGEHRPEVFRRLVLRGPRAVLEALVAEALARHRRDTTEPDGVPVYAWDDECWSRLRTRRPRPLDTVFLPEGVSESLLADLRAFFELASTLDTLHVTPLRTYLLHGTPGSGKSSCIHALASELGFGVATLPFVPGTTDQDVAAALRQLPARTLVVLEDIDCAFAGRSAKSHHVSFSTLLAALDGAYTETPVAVFVTTNTLQDLDPALRRRVDIVQDFQPATREQARRLYRAFFGDDAHFDAVWCRGRGSAMSVFHKYLCKAKMVGDPLAALDVLDALARAVATSDPPGYFV